MKKEITEPLEKRIYNVIKPIIGTALSLSHKITCIGQENIPEEGGFIIAANHISFLDPMMIIAKCPRPCHFMAKSELFEKHISGFFLRNMNAFPVKRGTSDKIALSFAENIINNGWVMGIFPEGTRSSDLKPKKAKSGVAYIAKKTKADVLPVSICRKKGKGFRIPVTLRFGSIIKNEELGFDGKYDNHQMKAAAEQIMQKITELWELDAKE